MQNSMANRPEDPSIDMSLEEERIIGQSIVCRLNNLESYNVSTFFFEISNEMQF